MTSLTSLPRTTLLVGISAIILVAELIAYVPGDDPDVGGWIGVSVFGIALAAVLVLVVVPRLRGPGRRNGVLGFGIAAVVTCAVFWTALPFALAAAAFAAAGPGDDRPEGEEEAPSTAGVLLAALAVVGAIVLCIVG